jgi:serine protease AprX
MIPFYTQISGTSMSTPFVAGVVALMLDADPTLSPDEIKEILMQTASRMPGYDEWEVGAGYVNVHAAVDKVFNRSKRYDSNFQQRYNAEFTTSIAAQESFRIDYSPAGLPGPGSENARYLTVASGVNVLDVFARFDNALNTGDGNSIGLVLTDPKGTKYTSGIALPVLDGTTRQILVKNPEAGQWLLEVRGVRGLAAAPNVSLPTSGAAAPGPVDFKVIQKVYNLAPVADIQGNPAQTQIESVLKNRQMDTFTNGLFHPDSSVTREDLARLLFFNTALRQNVGAAARFTDVSADLAPIAEAVTAKGSTMRDFYTSEHQQSVAGMMSATGSTFNPTGIAKRLDIAVALVRALGYDSEAKSMISAAGYTVTVLNKNDGKRYPLADNNEIPLSLRGYVQIALDKELLQAFYTMEQGQFDLYPTLKARVRPNDATTRSYMAFALDSFRKRFVANE